MGEPFITLDEAVLEDVTGGRLSQGPPQTDPQLLQAITTLSQSVKDAGAGVAQASQANSQGMMQMMQQMMQAKGGGGK
jgi:hypothetical protein